MIYFVVFRVVSWIVWLSLLLLSSVFSNFQPSKLLKKSLNVALETNWQLAIGNPLGSLRHHRDLDSLVAGGNSGLVVARIGVTSDADARIVCEHTIKTLGGFVCAIGH